MSRTVVPAGGRPVPAAVTALSELWAQRTADGESDTEYCAFLHWCERGARRGSPPAEHAPLARRYEWAQRALAYERAEKLAASAANGSTSEQRTVDAFVLVAEIEAAKMLKEATTNEGATLSPKDVANLVALVRTIQTNQIRDQSAALPLEKATTEELRIIHQAQAILRDLPNRK